MVQEREVARLQKEIDRLRKELAEAQERIRILEEEQMDGNVKVHLEEWRPLLAVTSHLSLLHDFSLALQAV